MRKLYFWLVSLLLAASLARVRAQDGPLHLTQTIALAPQASLGSPLLLPNHNTVLLLTNPDSPTLLAQCLAPDGHTLWKTELTCYNANYLFFATEGNEVVVKEAIKADLSKSKNKRSGNSPQLREGQTLVQRLDEQGQLTQHLFEPLPLPEGEKKAANYNIMARYATGDGYAEIVQETGGRREKYQTREHNPEQGPIIRYYNQKTNLVSTEALTLPAVPKSSREYQFWYTDWAYLGHYRDQLYFCRRSLADDIEQRPSQGPLLFHVYITNEHGQAASPSGFTTSLNLSPKTRVAYSGSLYSTSEMNHIPRYMMLSDAHGGGTDMDSWDMTTGGMGSLYLEYTTGNVLIYGEYTDENLKEFHRDHAQGLFFQRFTSDGRLLAQSQTAYSADMLKGKETLSFQADIRRDFSMHADPVSGQYHCTISPTDHWGNMEVFDLFVDHDLRWQRYDYRRREDKFKEKHIFTTVYYAQPYEYHNFFTNSTAHIYEHPHPTDPAVYAALEQLRRPDGPTPPVDPTDFGNLIPSHLFYLSATGTGTGLIVEQTQRKGGALKVYRF